MLSAALVHDAAAAAAEAAAAAAYAFICTVCFGRVHQGESTAASSSTGFAFLNEKCMISGGV